MAPRSILTAVALIFTGLTSSAVGATLTYEFVDPQTDTPLVRAVFTSYDIDRVLLRIEATTAMTPGRFIGEIGFDFDLGSALNVSSCYAALCGGRDFGTAPVVKSIGPGSIPPAGGFDLVFEYPVSNGPRSDRFEAGEYGAYLLSAAGLKLESFDAYNPLRFRAFTHLQGAGGDIKVYGVIPNDYNIPEPGMTWLLGSGLLGLGVLVRRRGKA